MSANAKKGFGPTKRDRFLADLLLRGIVQEGMGDHLSVKDRASVVAVLRSSAGAEFSK